jgi:hypothetical protein
MMAMTSVDGYPITFTATASEISPGDLNGSLHDLQLTKHRTGPTFV